MNNLFWCPKKLDHYMFRYQQQRQIKLPKLFINPLVGNEMNNSLSIISQSRHNPSVKQDALPRASYLKRYAAQRNYGV